MSHFTTPKYPTNRESTGNVTASHSPSDKRHIRTKESDAPDLALAARIKELIGEETNVAFAHACGFSEGMLRKYLKGATPGGDKMAAIAKYRRVRLEWLASGNDPKYERDLIAVAKGAGKTDTYARFVAESNKQYSEASNHSLINPNLLRLCLLTCNQVHGEDFSKAMTVIQIEYACDLYNQLTQMANAKGGTALEDFCRLDVAALSDQLRFLLQMGWARKFPFEPGDSRPWIF